MKNLLTETTETMSALGKSHADVTFIGSYNGKVGCSWEEFISLANFTYDDGYGTAEIAGDLVVVFRDGSWLERGEYDGSEWWSHRMAPRVSVSHGAIRRLDRGDTCLDTLSEINAEPEAAA